MEKVRWLEVMIIEYGRGGNATGIVWNCVCSKVAEQEGCPRYAVNSVVLYGGSRRVSFIEFKVYIFERAKAQFEWCIHILMIMFQIGVAKYL